MMMATMIDAISTTPSVEPTSDTVCEVGVADWIMAPAVTLFCVGGAGMVIAMAVRVIRMPAKIHKAMRRELGGVFMDGASISRWIICLFISYICTLCHFWIIIAPLWRGFIPLLYHIERIPLALTYYDKSA